MAEQVLKDARVVVGDFELDPYLGGASIAYAAELQDNTKFNTDTRSHLAGLKTATVAVNGFSDAANENADQFPEIGSIAIPFTVSQGNPTRPSTADDIGYMGEALYADYQPMAGTIGEMQQFEATLQANELAKGRITHDGNYTSTTQGTVFQLGALGVGDKILMACHVYDHTSGTVRFDLRSDDNVGMTTPTVRASSQVFSAVGSELVIVEGAITDDYWQIVATISAGNVDVVASMGIVTP